MQLLLSIFLLGTPDVWASQPIPTARIQQPGWLGVAFQELSPEKAKECGYDTPLLTITLVVKDSPAANYGVRKGDVYAKIDGEQIESKAAFIAHIKNKGMGETITLTRVCTQEKPEDITVMLGARPAQRALQEKVLKSEKAPGFSYMDYATKEEKTFVSDTGKVILLDFWATWCGPCLMSMPDLKTLHERYADQGLEIIGVTDEPRSKIHKIAQRYKLPYTLASNLRRDAFQKYSVSSLPTAILIDKEGQVQEIFIGAGHTYRIEKKIKELLR